jgi:hypothetical protein
MQAKIFQAYYRDDQLPRLDPEFTPFDNRANPVSNLYEYYIYGQLHNIAMQDKLDLWGHFSWQWKTKLGGGGVSARNILDAIAADPGHDVYHFTPWPQQDANCWNVWEHGDWCHPHMLELAEQILPRMDVDPKVVLQPMATKHYIVANYMVGNARFWTGLLRFLGSFVNAINRLEPEHQRLLDSSAGYEPNPKLDYRGFFCERLISTYLYLGENELSIRPFYEWYDASLSPRDKDLMVLKTKGISTGDVEALIQWSQMRDQPAAGKRNLAEEWLAGR